MKTLFILRHAKSSWDDAGLSDFNRPLNSRGLKTAPFMGRLMAEKGFLPSIILSSPASRAKTTAELVREAGNFECEIRCDELVYEASHQRLVNILKGIDDRHTSALIVGHNPSMEGLLFYLSQCLETMSTATIAVIELEIESWGGIKVNCGELKNIFRPRDEMK